jgi:hypothetical protein
VGKSEGRNHLEDLGVDRRIILRWIFRKWMEGGGGMDWIYLAQDRDRWWATSDLALWRYYVLLCQLATSDHAL